MPECDKLVKCHVITGLLQFEQKQFALEFPFCRIILPNKLDCNYYRNRRTHSSLQRKMKDKA